MKPDSKPPDAGNHQRAPLNRESIFDRKLQQWRNTGEFDKSAATSPMSKRTMETQRPTVELPKPPVADAGVNELEKAAFLDPLTEQFNQRTMLINLKDEIRRARRYKQSLGLLLVEIDKFEEFTANNSSLAIEYAFKGVANILSKHIREVDILGSLDDGRFLILCPETSMHQLSRMADRLRTLLATARLAHFGRRVSLTVSAGLSAYPETGENEADVLAGAIEALRIALDAGGDAVSWANPTKASNPVAED